MGLISRVSSRTYSHGGYLKSIPADIPMPDLSGLPWYRKEGSVGNPLEFVQAIEWEKETSLHIIVGFHLLFCIMVVKFWRNSSVRVFMWVMCCMGIYISEFLNEVGSKMYKELGFSEQYFDSQGYFMMTIWSLPLLLYLFILTLKFLYELWQTLIDVKIQQLKAQKRAQAETKKSK